MEKNSKQGSSINFLLSQSYTDEVRKVAGCEQAIPFNIEVSQEFVEERETTWSNLFKKYSTMVSEVVFNMRTLKPEEDEEDGQEDIEEVVEPRLPMRKSMSMVQYWVDTGQQLYKENFNDRSQSDFGSSLTEEEILKQDEAAFSRSANVNVSPEKQSEAVGISNSKFMRTLSSSSSSVDTAAYILANNNTTKKAETLAILEGSKFINKKQNNVLESLNDVYNVNSKNKSVEKIGIHEKCDTNKDSIQKRNNALIVEHFKENVNKTNNNSVDQEFDTDATKLVSEKSYVEKANGLLSTEVIESDESIFRSKNVTGVQRKKLYTNVESPVEFTPVSEANSSPKAPRLSMKQCEHPAFQTPRLSRQSLVIKKHRKTSKKRNFPFLSLIVTSKADKNNSIVKFNSELPTSLSKKSKIINDKDKIKVNIHNLLKSKNKSDGNLDSKSSDCNNDDSTKVQQPLDRRNNINVKKSLNHSNRFNLKTVYLTIHRLPYTYGNTKVDTDEERKKLNQLDAAFSDTELSNKLYPNSAQCQKRYTQDVSLTKETALQNIKKDNLKRKLEISPIRKEYNHKNNITEISLINSKKSISNIEKVKAAVRINNNISVTLQNKSPGRKADQSNKILFNKSAKYVIVSTSSDESENIIHVSKKKYKIRSSKQKTTIDEKLDNNRAHELIKQPLNLNGKETRSTLKSTVFESQESDIANTSDLTDNKQTNTLPEYKEKESPIKEKFVDSKIKKIKNKDIVLDKSMKYVPVLTSSDESIIHVSNDKFKKRLSKRKTTIDKKLDNNRAYELIKQPLNLNRKEAGSTLKSTVCESEESDTSNTSNLKDNQQTNTLPAHKDKASPIKEKFVDSKIKKIQNKDIVLDKSMKDVPVLTSSDESIIHVSNDKFKKRLSKRNTTIDEKSCSSRAHELIKQPLNLNTKETGSTLKSRVYESDESDTIITSSLKGNQQTNTLPAHKDKASPIKEKFVDSKIKIIQNKDIIPDKSMKNVPVLTSSDESIIHVSNEKFKKRLSKRKTTIDKKLDSNRADELIKQPLNLNKKETGSTLKSTVCESDESDTIITSNLKDNQQSNTMLAHKDKASPVKKKFVDLKIKKIENKDKNPAVSTSLKKNNDRNSDTLSNKKVQAQIESKSRNRTVNNKTVKISGKLMDKPLAVKDPLLLNEVNNSNDLLTKKQNTRQCDKLFDQEEIDVINKMKVTIDKKSKESIKSKKSILDEDCQDLQETNFKRKATKKSKSESTKDSKSKKKSKRKSDEFLILSDDECIVPLKMKA